MGKKENKKGEWDPREYGCFTSVSPCQQHGTEHYEGDAVQIKEVPMMSKGDKRGINAGRWIFGALTGVESQILAVILTVERKG